jgi:HK97 family phage major capsid protein
VAASTESLSELTAEQVQRILVQPLQDRSVFLASGPRIFDVVAAGPVRIPKMVGMTAEPQWYGENELIGETDPDTDEVVLLDGTKSLKVICRYSNELARSTVVSLEAALRDRLVYDVAKVMDAALIAGDGADDTPVGLLNYTGTQEMAAVGVPTLDDLHDAIGMALAENVDPSRLRWWMTSRDYVNLRKIKQATGSNQYALQPDATQATAQQILGVPVVVTNRIPENEDGEASIVLADMSRVAVARDLNPSVVFLRETFAQWDQQGIRVVARLDAAPLNPEAIIILRGVTAA